MVITRFQLPSTTFIHIANWMVSSVLAAAMMSDRIAAGEQAALAGVAKRLLDRAAGFAQLDIEAEVVRLKLATDRTTNP